MKKAIFVADAHLKSPAEDSYRDLIDFFDELYEDKELDTLYVLGDLFDFFVGFPKIIFYEHMEAINGLKRLADKGVSVFYFEGNHDFFLRKLNKVGLPFTIVEKGMDVYFGKRKFFVTHGDRTDYAHRLLSFLVKNPFTNLFSYILPPHLVYDFAHLFSRFSREKISSKRVFKLDLLRHFAEEYAKFGYFAAVFGHFHKSMLIDGEAGLAMPVYLVGSWKEGRDYLVYENGNFFFKKYKSVGS